MLKDFAIAEALAADLAGGRVDANEAQKVLAYLRSKRSGRALFDYLRAINTNGRAVIRSNQTLDYYREIQSACQRHLRPLENDYEQLVQVFAWSLRLLRYYRAVPDAAAERLAAQRGEQEQATAAAVSSTVQPRRKALPEVGDVFGGKVCDVFAEGVLIEVPGFDLEAAIGRVKPDQLGGKTYRVGDTARVEVIAVQTRKSGRAVLDCKPAPKKQK